MGVSRRDGTAALADVEAKEVEVKRMWPDISGIGLFGRLVRMLVNTGCK